MALPPRTFTKPVGGHPDGALEAEAAGLRWLTDAAGARVVRVLGEQRSDGRVSALVLEALEAVRPDQAAARAFGRALARTHDAGAAGFGAAPDGWTGPTFIGRQAQRTTAAGTPSWGAFFAADRVLPFVEVAERRGHLGAGSAEVVRAAARAVASGRFDDDGPPARIHGDLWSGNLLWTADGGVLIDPAAHGGRRETDLAMLALFGCPHLDAVVEGYEDEHPLVPGRAARVPVHQLHPLAVHTASHGASYAPALLDAAQATLKLADGAG